MKNKRFSTIVLAVLCSVTVAFFVFAFIDFSASGPGEDPETTETQDQETEETEATTEQNGGDSKITNSVQNQVDGNEAEITNNVENNTNGDQAEIENTIDNQLNNSHHNKIDNNVTNNIDVSVNVNVTNNITNHAEGNEANKENGQQKEETSENGTSEGESTQDTLHWGVDSASLTTEEMLACVTGNFGSPAIWGRYLGDKEGVSRGLTAEEVELLHANDIQVLVIWNHFTDARGYENGQQQAQAAIQMAKEFGVPEGVALFANIEPIYPVDSEFIRGWFDALDGSEYESGVYGVFDAGSQLANAYEQAGQSNNEILERNYIWTAYPQAGITTEADAPEYGPEAPENSLIGGWQYGLDAETCNIDTNLFHSDLLDVVW